jgi:hypothetical protein
MQTYQILSGLILTVRPPARNSTLLVTTIHLSNHGGEKIVKLHKRMFVIFVSVGRAIVQAG